VDGNNGPRRRRNLRMRGDLARHICGTAMNKKSAPRAAGGLPATLMLKLLLDVGTPACWGASGSAARRGRAGTEGAATFMGFLFSVAKGAAPPSARAFNFRSRHRLRCDGCLVGKGGEPASRATCSTATHLPKRPDGAGDAPGRRDLPPPIRRRLVLLVDHAGPPMRLSVAGATRQRPPTLARARSRHSPGRGAQGRAAREQRAKKTKSGP